jgi:hypothetical protein
MTGHLPDPWRFLEEAPAQRPRPGLAAGGVPGLDAAWLRLLILHTPFRPTAQTEFLALTDVLRRIEQIFLTQPALAAYYAECFHDETTRAPERGGDDVPQADQQIRHVVMLQTQLMEDVFLALRLDRYGNAPDNRGWMNLFRRWGRSPTFNRHFANVRATFTPAFGQFYEYYLRELDSIDRQPIPHHWDPERDRYGATVVPADGDMDGWKALRHRAHDGRGGASDEPAAVTPVARTRAREVPGVLLDSGIRALPPLARGSESDVNDVPNLGAGTTAHGSGDAHSAGSSATPAPGGPSAGGAPSQ